MEKRIKVSVIVPIYNGEAFVERCCRQLVEQTLNNIEIILVDDGSVDQSLSVCQRMCGLYSNIKLIHQENQGVSAARNNGMAIAQGQYIGFVDVDDTWDTDLFETFYKLAERHSLDLLSTSIQKKRGDESLRLYDRRQDALADFLMGKIGMSVCGKLFRRTLLPDFYFPAGIKINEDNYAVFRAINKAERIGTINIVTKYHYEQREGSSSRASAFTAKYLDMLKINTSICEEVENKYPELHDLCRRRTANIYLRMAKIYYLRQYPETFRKQIDDIKQWLLELTWAEQKRYYKKTNHIRYLLYLRCFPLFYILIKTIDRK